MESLHKVPSAVAVAALLGLSLTGCAFDEPGVNPVVFKDSFNDNQPQRFGSSIGTTIGTDAVERIEGFDSLKVTVPDQGCAGADTTHFCYAGWAIVANTPRDLSGFDALTFWAKSSTATASLDEVGFGQDNTGGSKYVASVTNLAITSTWTKFVLPLPAPGKLTKEKGLIYFSAGTQSTGGAGFTFWLDDVRFETLGPSVLGPARPSVGAQTLTRKVGTQLNPGAATVTFAVNGADVKLGVMPAYFTWTSSNPTVATVSDGGVVSTLSFGTAKITATLGAVSAAGELDIVVPGGGTAPGALVLFGDDFASGGFQAFGNALGTLALDTTSKHAGAASLKVNVPSDGCAGSDTTHFCYAGGAVVSDSAQDLSLYNALTFWAKASTASATFAVFGLGNDNSGTSKYTASMVGPKLTTDWVQYVLPIPLASKLGSERGMYYFAAANLAGVGYTIWLDDIQYEYLPATVLGAARPSFTSGSVSKGVGDTFKPGDASALFKVNGVDQTVSLFPSYLTWTSSNTAVVTVAGDGTCTAAGKGSATVTAKLGDIAATGALSVTVN